jgi:hypothetical protein
MQQAAAQYRLVAAVPGMHLSESVRRHLRLTASVASGHLFVDGTVAVDKLRCTALTVQPERLVMNVAKFRLAARDS